MVCHIFVYFFIIIILEYAENVERNKCRVLFANELHAKIIQNKGKEKDERKENTY